MANDLQNARNRVRRKKAKNEKLHRELKPHDWQFCMLCNTIKGKSGKI